MSNYIFTHGARINCPDCAPSVKALLSVTERNYSGASVDIGNCEECGRGFEISFMIKRLKSVASWDGPSRAEREDFELSKKLSDERAESERLWREFLPKQKLSRDDMIKLASKINAEL